MAWNKRRKEARMRRWIVLLAVAAMAMALVACGKKAKKADEAAASAIVSKAVSMASGQETKVDVSGETVTFRGDDGTVVVTGKGAELPDDFPSDVPVYRGVQIMHSASSAEGHFSVSMTTLAPRTGVADYYKMVMPEEGWESQSTMNMPNATMLAYKKGNRAVSVMIAESDEGTVVTISGGTE